MLVMKYLTVYPITVLLLFAVNFSYAQFNVDITVNSGSSTTTCDDNIGTPDPMWSVNIENEGWVTYPSNLFCYTDFPNTQFSRSYQCISDIPPTIQVCFRAFENDASILDPCTEVTSCLVETCIDVPVPPFGSADFDIDLPDNLDSDGTANFTIATSGIPGGVNDLPCQALDIGIIENDMTVGLVDTSIFNNFCSSNLGEPTPSDFGTYFINHRGVWFKFTANADPKTLIKIEARSDPSNFGDPINIEMGVFSSATGTCNGPWTFYHTTTDLTDWDETIYLRCPQPNTEYYILVDGNGQTSEAIEGYFSLQITELDVEEVGDQRCEAWPLGAVPPGGSVGTPEPVSNGCATGAGDPPTSAFGVQAGVWFTFEAPPTGHVFVEAVSDTIDDEIGLQLAAFSSSTDDCTGFFTEVSSIYTDADLDETLELNCLDAGRMYFILVDGAVSELNQGVFEISVTDAGDETPVTTQDTTICFGEILEVGPFVHDQSGMYEDTLQLPSGCDSIVISTLTVLTDIDLNFTVENVGLNQGNTDGTAQVAPTGGAGGYTVSWSDGQTTELAANLIGGDNYCVVVTDQHGCVKDTCFEMPYYENFITQITSDSLDCFGDVDGEIQFTAILGVPPYQYTWQNSMSTQSGSGSILFDGQMISLSDLPADTYSLNISDINFDTTIFVEVLQPDLLEVDAATVNDASCFANCDGDISVNIIGGTPPYQFAWSNGGIGPAVLGLCAADYQLTVTDAKDCSAIFDFEIEEPDEFIATAMEVQAVSCFEGSDGQATVSTNGTPISFQWSNAGATETITDMEGGNYTVTVTNSDGCTATASVEVNTPNAPVEVTIEVVEPVLCNGDDNAILQANVTGPGTTFTSDWAHGQTGATANEIGAGDYSVAVTNELGCEATASFTLTEPSLIQLNFSTNQLTCNDPADGGIVTVDDITGGVEPYLYSANGITWSTEPAIPGFTAGENIFYVQDAGGCIREFETTIDGPGELILNLGDDLTIDLGDEVRLESQVNNPNVTYQWSPPEGMTCPDCDETEVTPVESMLYTLVVTDEYECTAVSDVYVTVLKKRKVFVPNAFSPNGDGVNDEFVPFGGKDVVLIKDFKVFDRQGNMVFENDNFEAGNLDSGWKGFFRGKMMQAGVFVWFAEVEFLDGEVEVFKGDVNLIR